MFDMRTVPGPVLQNSANDTLSPEWDLRNLASAQTLPEGTRLLDYEIVGTIGEGGFGIVYLAFDHALQRHVAIKEFLPATLASRASLSAAVVVKSQRHRGGFEAGLRGFINEARILARFDHPSLVRVLRFWEGNGTAYMAMPYYEGTTLAEALHQRDQPPGEEEISGWLRPLLAALGTLHAENCFHRDIAPDNILLTDDGPVLLDFGAARRVIDGEGSAPTVLFKAGFTPIEQFGDHASMKQGAWTDLYALAGVVHMAITGQPPAPSVQRAMNDTYQPLAERARGRYSPSFLAAIDAALALRPEDRPRTTAEFRARLQAPSPTAPTTPTTLAVPSTAPTTPTAPIPPTSQALRASASALAAQLHVQSEPAAAGLRAHSEPAEPGPYTLRPPAEPHRGMGLVLGAVAVLVAFAIGGYQRIAGPGPASPPPAPVAPVAQSATSAPIAPIAPIAQQPPAKPASAPSPIRAPLPATPRATEAPAAPPRAAVPAIVPDSALDVLSAPEAPRRTLRRYEAPRPVPRAEAQAEDAAMPSAAEPPLSAIPASRARAPGPRPRSRPQMRAQTQSQSQSPPLQSQPPDRPPEAPAQPLQPTARNNAACTEVLQRASLGPLTSGEAAFLRKVCQQ
jgi:serine/threonine protein kinase